MQKGHPEWIGRAKKRRSRIKVKDKFVCGFNWIRVRVCTIPQDLFFFLLFVFFWVSYQDAVSSQFLLVTEEISLFLNQVVLLDCAFRGGGCFAINLVSRDGVWFLRLVYLNKRVLLEDFNFFFSILLFYTFKNLIIAIMKDI